MTRPRINPDDALTFCRVVLGDEPTEFRLIHSGSRKWPVPLWGFPENAEQLGALADFNGEGYSVYAVVNRCHPSVEQRTKARPPKGARDQDIIGVRAVYIDFDSGDYRENTAKLASAPLPPSLVLSSGLPENQHAYWLVADLPVEDFRRTQKALISHFGSDPNVFSEAHVMRVPGFVNMKPKYAPNYPLARILAAPEHVYTRAELFEAFGIPADEPAPAPVEPQRRSVAIRGGNRRARYVWAAVQGEHDLVASAREGSRNATLHRAAVKLGTLVGAGVLQESDATDVLQLAAQHCGLPDREALNTIASGLAYGKEHPRELQGRP